MENGFALYKYFTVNEIFTAFLWTCREGTSFGRVPVLQQPSMLSRAHGSPV